MGVLALVLAAASQASAQLDPSLIEAIDAMGQNGALPGTGQRTPNPLQPTGFPGLPEKVPGEKVDEEGYALIHADGATRKGQNVELEGAVEFLARGYHIRCDRAVGNIRNGIYTAEGHVLITGNGATVYGERVTVDTVNDSYVAERAETQVDPDFLQNRVTDKVYVSGRLSAGTRLLTHTQDGFITTCDLENPHWGLTARDVEVRTGKRAILRDSKLRILGKTILQIPYLVIPLEDRTLRNTPAVGRTQDEGYFVKNVYNLNAKNGYVQTREDLMEKKGLGLGATYVFGQPRTQGLYSAYKVFGSDTLNLSASHRQVFGWGSVALDGDYQNDNYLVAPDQTVTNLRGAVVYNDLLGDRAQTRLTLNRTANSAAAYSSRSETIGVGDQRYVGKLRTDSQVNLLTTGSAYQTGTETETKRAQVKFQGSQELGPASAAVQYQRTIPVGKSTNYIGGSDLTPVFSLSSDSRRLLGAGAGDRLPFRTELSYGQYADARLKTNTERTAFALSFNKSASPQSRFSVDSNGNFRQGLYSDDTAQYILGLNENLRYRLGPDTGVNLRYAYLRPYGYSPLSIDSTGRTNTVSLDANARPIRSLLLGVQTGYDILREKEGEIAWQQVGLRSEWTPRPGILLRGQATYNSFDQVFNQVRLDFSSYGREARFTLNAQFDGKRHTWSAFNGTLDGLRIGRTKIAALFSYNGYTRQFETRQYAFTYDLHCAEAVLSVQENNFGFRPGRQVFFLLRLKALPFDLPFGLGTRGQGVGTGSGIGF